jgi:hypothetical protein
MHFFAVIAISITLPYRRGMTHTYSRRLALVFGILLPIAETVRRWHQISAGSHILFWLDDVLLGTLLLYAVWRTRNNAADGQRFLSAAWGCALGMGYFSFFGKLADPARIEPGPLPGVWVEVIVGTGLLLSVMALIGSLRKLPPA